MFRSSLILISALMLVACENESAPVPPPPQAAPTVVPPEANAPQQAPAIELPSIGPKAQTSRKAEIDWASARADLASSGVVSIQSAGEEPAEVPVLIPTGIVTSQSADTGPVFRRTADGYFAFYPGDVYNIIVNGTNQVVEADAISTDNAERAPVFSTTVAGAQVWLTKYGADYTVEFECNALADEDSTCIEEDAAMQIANSLIVSGSR